MFVPKRLGKPLCSCTIRRVPDRPLDIASCASLALPNLMVHDMPYKAVHKRGGIATLIPTQSGSSIVFLFNHASLITVKGTMSCTLDILNVHLLPQETGIGGSNGKLKHGTS